MSDDQDQARFTFSWLALRLLGRGLYSNPWSALSELVANGLDAGAENVYVYIDARDNTNAIVEIIDDGSGMSREDIDTYVKVGHNKRKSVDSDDPVGEDDLKGRKGIGKLAALFLSQHFFIQTRHQLGQSAWELDARIEEVSDDEFPLLLSSASPPSTPNDEIWNSLESGTRLTLTQVDLSGYGSKSISGLGARLANQFLLQDSSKPQIFMCVQLGRVNEKPEYTAVSKNIAFKNLADVAWSFQGDEVRPEALEVPLPTVLIRATGLPSGEFIHRPEPVDFAVDPDRDQGWDEIEAYVDLKKKTYRGVKYRLSGWIGLHASINMTFAKRNDERFEKNKFYNPAQLRVYVRGKLASDRLLSQLGLTGTYLNYIEGEISFDLLDANELPDIATSNRQDFDETDGRVALLRALVRPTVRNLIKRRNELAHKISKMVEEEEARKATASKKVFSDQLDVDLSSYEAIPDHIRHDLHAVITNKIQGEVSPKTKFRVFISHSSADKTFATFIDELLQTQGVRRDEIFYTSREGSIENALKIEALQAIVKKSIVDANTLIFYMTSKNFLGSQYCLFEGGAGWATRAVSDYLKLNVDYDSIPKFLTNGNYEIALLDSRDSIELRPDVYKYLVEAVLNPMIEHINRGREIAQEGLVPFFETVEYPSQVDMIRQGKTMADYYDVSIREHWEMLVEGSIPEYVQKYTAPPTSPNETE